jgi:cytochrome b6-f complex iron-sulfur subunit
MIDRFLRGKGMEQRGRRQFLLTALGASGVLFAGFTAYPVFRYLSPRSATGEREWVAIPRARVGEGQAYFFQFRGHPAVVLQRSPGVFVAFSAICTHLGCIIKWLPDKGEFLCPCHAGRYAGDGRVLGGPPPKPLQTIPVALSGDNLLIG